MALRAAGVRPEAGKPQRLGEQALLEHSTRVKAVAAQVRERRGEERLTVWRGRGAPSHSVNNKARAPPPRPPSAVGCPFGRSKAPLGAARHDARDGPRGALGVQGGGAEGAGGAGHWSHSGVQALLPRGRRLRAQPRARGARHPSLGLSFWREGCVR